MIYVCNIYIYTHTIRTSCLYDLFCFIPGLFFSPCWAYFTDLSGGAFRGQVLLRRGAGEGDPGSFPQPFKGQLDDERGEE